MKANEKLMTNYEMVLEASLLAGIPMINTDTSAKILAVIYVLGGGEEKIVYNPKLIADIRYIQKRFHIDGSETPSKDIIPMLREYVANLSDKSQDHQWVNRLFKERYDFEFKTI